VGCALPVERPVCGQLATHGEGQQRVRLANFRRVEDLDGEQVAG
jgi:hypothetical protein